MSTVFLAASFTLVIVSVLEALTRVWAVHRWPARGITVPVTVSAAAMRIVGAVVASIVWAVLAGGVVGVAAGVTAGVAVWLVALSWYTDVRCGKIPREPCWTVALIAVAMGAGAGIAGAVDMLLAFALVGVIAVLSAALPLGGGDVRLLVALAPLSAFTSAIVFAVGVVAAGIMQWGWRRARRLPSAQRAAFAPALGMGVVATVTLGLLMGSKALLPIV